MLNQLNPLLLTDFYKTEHHRMMPEGTTRIYSNFTPRKSRIDGVSEVVFFGLQAFIASTLVKRFDQYFFKRPWAELDAEYKRHVNVNTDHLLDLHAMGYLPLCIKALPEGTRVPIGVPCLTITNTHPDHAWLVNYLETLISAELWQATTSATKADQYRQLLTTWAKKTAGTAEGVQWQAHDFSMRGMSSVESAIKSGMGHLTSFTGTDTIPAIYAIDQYYPGDNGLVGASVPATEHSVMCMGTKDDELGTFKRLLELYPDAPVLSVVSDTWDLWKVCTKYLPALKDYILARPGKLVIRPDSGDPVDIICGHVDEDTAHYDEEEDQYYAGFWTDEGDFVEEKKLSKPEFKGVVELLWDVFGGTENEQGYKVLDPHIGAIYGDSITLERAEAICQRLADKGFASTNIVLGVGSFTYQYNTRDTFGFAMKATYGELTHLENEVAMGITLSHQVPAVEPREIFKDPITDDGTKKSKKGLLRIDRVKGKLVCLDQQTWDREEGGELKVVFLDGMQYNTDSLARIRARIANEK